MIQIGAASRFKQRWVQMHSGLWFVPALIIVTLALLAVGLVETDRHLGEQLRVRWPRLFETGADGAHSILSAIAGSMANIAGVTFSITMVALTLAAGQYTSRIMRNFMRDRANQVVLGLFVGIHLYCLLVLRAVDGEPGGFVPACAILGALVLAAVASGAFIFFIHHIASTIQASDMTQAITRETLRTVGQLFPQQREGGSEHRPAALPGASAWHPVPARRWGYVQTVAESRLAAFARAHAAVVRMERKPGDFIDRGDTIVSVAMENAPDDKMITELNRAYGIDGYRTIDQDPAFGIRQLVDIALKALSPGINDTTTAVECLEHAGVILAHCTRHDLAPQHHYDGAELRVLSIGLDLADLITLAFSQVSESAEGNTEILLRILRTIDKLDKVCGAGAARRALQERAAAVSEIAMRSAKSRSARDRLVAQLQGMDALLVPGAPPPAAGGADPHLDD